jgi:hypothetical protein
MAVLYAPVSWSRPKARRGPDLEQKEARYVKTALRFCRVHQTLRVTPAMAAGLSDHVWELSELIALMPKPIAKAWGSVKRAASASA